MRAAVRVREVSKVFALAERGDGPVSLIEALRTGQRSIRTREVRALENITFDLDEGERVGIIGPNGAGKTTLLSILAGLSEPTSGSVEVDGDVHAMLTIGAVLREDLTGRQNIYLDASVHGRTRAEIADVAERIVGFAELGEFIERPVRTYSSGMKARLAFSMGAFIDPDILIIDETLSVGDVFFAGKASERMKEIAAGGRIVIMVSHGLGTIVDMCTRCLWLDRGRLVMDGPPKAVTQAYDAFVRETDEKELLRKFGSGSNAGRPEASKIVEAVDLVQNGEIRKVTVAAMVPLSIIIKGRVQKGSGPYDLTLSVLRVDGRLVWRQSLSKTGCSLPANGSFSVRVDMAPFVLGADLYRLDASTSDAAGVPDNLSRVFEVVDNEGQYGGKPLLYYPPQITARRLE